MAKKKTGNSRGRPALKASDRLSVCLRGLFTPSEAKALHKRMGTKLKMANWIREVMLDELAKFERKAKRNGERK